MGHSSDGNDSKPEVEECDPSPAVTRVATDSPLAHGSHGYETHGDAEDRPQKLHTSPHTRLPLSQGASVNAEITEAAGMSCPPVTSKEDVGHIHETEEIPGTVSSASAVSGSEGLLTGAKTASHKGRDRGYSLRRSLFARNISNTSNAHGMAIEMELSSSSRSLPSIANRSWQGEKGNKSEATVTIPSSAKDEEVDSIPTSASFGTKTPSLSRYRPSSSRKGDTPGVLHRFRQYYRKTRSLVLKTNGIPPSKDGRHIELDNTRREPLLDERTGKPYMGNSVRSSRYTLWNFVPRQLFFQFSKLANFYFLCVSILQMIPGLSTTGTYTTIVPLLVFVSISMAKEGYDDVRRWRLDKEENNRNVHVLHACETDSVPSEAKNEGLNQLGKRSLTPWKDIRVGDVIQLERNEAVPADLILLHARGQNGTAYLETMALDGETNLKGKQPPRRLANRFTNSDTLGQDRAQVVLEDPNQDLYRFDGKITVSGETFPLTNNEIIYRGSVLRNTEEAVGMVIYTGEECKIRMNANKNPRIKRPSLQAVVNRVVLLIVVLVIALAIFNTVAYHIWSRDTEEKSWYIHDAAVPIGQIFVSFIIMFNTMIPLSLYVSMEIVKLFQMFLLNDIDMYDEATDTPMEARTSTINEELGQVSYIFSDKTGTLTDNSMRFRKMSVAGTAWLHDRDLREEAEQEGEKQKLFHKKRSVKGKGAVARTSNTSNTRRSSRKSGTLNVDSPVRPASIDRSLPAASVWKPSTGSGQLHHGGQTEEMLAYLQRRPYTVFAKKARFFLLALALCHTCIPEQALDGGYSFQSASPDEQALVEAAKDLGYLVVSTENNTITVRSYALNISDEPVYETYQVLDVIDFSSARKRMSIIVRMPDQRICVFCKGADSTMMSLLRLSDLAITKVAEIERRANKRKSIEASHVLRRQSENRNHRDSTSRASIALDRASVGGRLQSRMSASGNMSPSHDSVDAWLKERTSTGGPTPNHDNSRFYSPRPSAQFGTPRASLADTDGRHSSQTDHRDELVEEALVIDDAAVFERCFQHVNDFATEGLRTLLYCNRLLSEDEYSGWKKLYLDATTSLVDRQHKIEQVAELVENQFELIGATAIEDKLQKGVPEAIDKLRRANIKLWMLTGDKRETAITIGHSCRLIKDYSTITILDHETGEVDQRIGSAIGDIRHGKIAHSVVVVDGRTLQIIEAQEVVWNLFLDLAILADSVVCCRASPSQKALLVKAIRKRVKRSITLAIGDGANDIAMIQEAHVGIGITGKEGLQAARTSDYSIAQFRFLLKLLLVHGRWNYIRVCKYTLSTFWKEMMFYLTQALYQRWNGYTGTSLYEPWSLSMFNTLFTSLPVIFMGIFEKDLAASTLLAVPELYTKGQRNGGFNIKLYLWWAFMAAAEAQVIFFVAMRLYGDTIFTKDNGLYAMGALSFTACVIIISTKIQILEMHNKSVMALIAVVVSVGGWFLWNILLDLIYSNNVIYNVKGGLLHRFGDNFLWWFTLILIISAVVVLELGVSSIRAAIWPTDVDIFQECEQDLQIRKRFEEAAADDLQQGWDRGTKKSSIELAREAEVAATREAQVQELLDKPRVMEEGRSVAAGEGQQVRRRRSETDHDDTLAAAQGTQDETTLPKKKSLDIQELFSKGYGTVRKGQELN